MATQKPISKPVSQPKPKPITDVPAIFSTEKEGHTISEQPPVSLPAVYEEPIEANPYHGLSEQPVSPKAAEVLMAPIDPNDVEIRPDGIIYLPEIKYRRVLNKAFGPGGWGLMPRGEFTRMGNTLTRAYALFVSGRFVSEAQGEMEYIENNPEMTWATCSEGVRSNALMRNCKDIGIASECWDPVFINKWLKDFAIQVWRAPKPGRPTRPQWRRKDRDPFYDETGIVGEKKPQQQTNHGGSKEYDSRDGSPPPGESNRPGIGNSPEYVPPTKAHADLKAMINAQMKVEDVSESQILLKLSSWPDRKLKDGTLKKGFGGVSTYEGMSEKLALYCIKTFNELREKAKKAAR